MIICSATRGSRLRSSRACAEWDGCGGRGNRQRGARARPARAGGRIGAPQSVRRLRDAQSSQPSEQRNYQNLRRDYWAAIRRLHDLGVMINGSFVFGMDGDDPSVFERTVEWAIEHGIETATFHILTPYPGTALYRGWRQRPHHDRTTGTVRHPSRVFRPAQMTAADLENGTAGPTVSSTGGDRSCAVRRRTTTVRRPATRRVFGRVEEVRAFWDLIIRTRRAGSDAAGARDDPQ